MSLLTIEIWNGTFLIEDSTLTMELTNSSGWTPWNMAYSEQSKSDEFGEHIFCLDIIFDSEDSLLDKQTGSVK